MEYGRLGKAEPGPASTRVQSMDLTPKPKITKVRLLLIIAAVITAAAVISAAVAVVIRIKANSAQQNRRPSQAISRACSHTLHQSLCLNSLLEFPGALTASDKDLTHISVNLTLQKVGRSLYSASEITNFDMDSHVRSAYDDCIELLDHSVDLLARSLTSVAPDGESTGSTQDVMTWLSASLTNQDTCIEAFDELNGDVKNEMSERLKDLSELTSNSLAIYSASEYSDDDIADIPIQNRRRRLMSGEKEEQFPAWLSTRERMLLDIPASEINADIVVAKDGNGTLKTIAEAIKKAPKHSKRRFIIYVRAGRYEEDQLKVGRKMTNIMFIGDGKGKTVITGAKSVADKLTTFHTASFAATGAGFIARDITFENYAGAGNHQAVALRVGADHAVVYRCSITGYQDTLYTHSQRQFYRECDIHGTIDFIFGNAAVVFQSCTIYARKPMPNQKNTITAQNRKDPNQNTGISIHNCRIKAEAELEASKEQYSTYLGRPWRSYSRAVYMQTYLGDLIHPQGWLQWNDESALDTLYYGEYMNYGPGAGLGQRVKWPGFRVITSAHEASKFTVARFIHGSAWLPSTGVAFAAGLSD